MSQQDRQDGPPRSAVPRARVGAHSQDSTPTPGTSTPGIGIPGIDLGEVIGHGGFATVYLGRQRGLDRPVAVKIDSRPLSDERNRRRFFREATASSRISGHPHVVSLIDAGTTTDGRPYLVMEWCPHGSLKGLLRRTGPMRPAEVPSPPTVSPRTRRGAAAGLVGLVAGLALGGGVGVAIDRTLLRGDDPVAAGAATASEPAAGDTAAGAEESPAGGDTPVSSSAPDVGVCWHGINAIGSAVTAAEVSCNEPHYWETFASGVLTTAGTPYVQDVAADPAVLETCTKDALRSYAGSATPLEIAVLPPDVIAWEAGDRGFSCVAGLRAGGETEGTLRRD